jgi:malate dehydrogenase (oxaloacetate-decarboxylating)
MFLGLSVANILKPEDLQVMRRDAIVFALANPQPEVDPEGARQYARIIATGGSEYENQINNALVFPGIMKGALEARVGRITMEMKLAAARALAAVVSADSLREDYIIPSIFDPAAHEAVTRAVKCAAHECGLARRVRKRR